MNQLTAPILVASPASVRCTDLTLEFPVYGADARSLKKRLAAVTVGGRLGRHAGVTKVTALSGVNLELAPGDRLGLVGHNGSGKTTLLRALAGAYEPDAGCIEITGKIAALLDLSLGLDDAASGYENIRLAGRIAGLSSREIRARMDDIAAFTGLESFLALPVKTYSAGMRARLAFAAATAVEADVLLMDEWIAVGDRGFRDMAHRRLQSLVERAGVLVLASHDPGILRQYCNLVMRLDAGRASPVAPIERLDELLAG